LRESDKFEDISTDGIEMDLKEIGLEVLDWIHLVQDRTPLQILMNTTINVQS
jgi:hypothetical protein